MWNYLKENWLAFVILFLAVFFFFVLLLQPRAHSMRLLNETPSSCVEVASPFQGGGE